MLGKVDKTLYGQLIGARGGVSGVTLLMRGSGDEGGCRSNQEERETHDAENEAPRLEE